MATEIRVDLATHLVNMFHIEMESCAGEVTYYIPAEPEPIACDSLLEVVSELYWMADREAKQLEKLQAFKKYVHDRLDAAGVNKHEEQNAINGCRIGSRLDDVLRISDAPSRSSAARPGVGGAVESSNADEKPGSAETGGEKAAPRCLVTGNICGTDTWGNGYSCLCKNCQRWLATLPRPSQNQTVASGVEGAHEGTTADKSEPEKLNNAQPPTCERCGRAESDHPLWGGTKGSLLHCHKFIESGTEPSLSSPPPRLDGDDK